MHQVILNMLVTKYFDNKVFDYIEPWVETLVYVSWAIRASYQRTIQATPGQAVFSICNIFNLKSVVDWRVITTEKQRQVDIYYVRYKSRQVMHEYAIGYLVYVERTVIYLNLYHIKQGPYKILEVNVP